MSDFQFSLNIPSNYIKPIKMPNFDNFSQHLHLIPNYFEKQVVLHY